MGTGNDSILEAFLFETNGLLEQLDSIVLAAEQEDTFSDEDINTIFRIMHTIKGSSAMMEYDSLMTIAHRAEDLFAIIRTRVSPWSLSRSDRNYLICSSKPLIFSGRRSTTSKMTSP